MDDDLDQFCALVPVDDEGRLFLSAEITDWKPVLDRGINVVIDLEGGIDRGVPEIANRFLYIYLPIADGDLPDLDRLHAVAKLAVACSDMGNTRGRDIGNTF